MSSNIKGIKDISVSGINTIFVNLIGKLDSSSINGKINYIFYTNKDISVIGKKDDIIPLMGSSYYVNLVGRIDKVISIRASSETLVSNNLTKASNES